MPSGEVWKRPPKDVSRMTDEEIEPDVAMEIGFEKIVVIDNIPVIPDSKFEKLQTVITKILSSIGKLVLLHIPKDEKNNTVGFAFAEFSKAEEAENAIQKLDGYQLDKNHNFRVNSYEDFRKYETLTEEYGAPEMKPYEPKGDLLSWLKDESADQYCLHYGNITEIVWNSDLKPGKVEAKRPGWTDTFPMWSPKGTYLLTFSTANGTVLWGGSNWDKLNRFPQAGVTLADFSPCERYLVTASPQYKDNDDPKDPKCIIVWDVRTGKKLRGFLSGQTTKWPVFQWSHDGNYLARSSPDKISVYQTPKMDLLDSKSIKIEGVTEFSWSPSENTLAYFVPEENNKPASVVLMEIPSRKEKRQKSLFGVGDCKMFWHPSGKFLSVKVERLTKKKKATGTDFEVFRMREKNIPIEHIELKDTMSAFAWEPKGNRFAVIHGGGVRPNVSFYSIGKQVKHLKTLEKKVVNRLSWSPQGSFIVLAGLDNSNGALEFFNANEMETMATEELFMASSVEWDPTGRYFTTVVSAWRNQMETGYTIYSFQGKVLQQVQREKFFQLSWRPRPPSLLSEERQREIKQNLNKYSAKYEKADKEQKEEEKVRKRKQREETHAAFTSILSEKLKRYEAEREERHALGLFSDDEGDVEEVEEWVEEVEEYQEIPVEE